MFILQTNFSYQPIKNKEPFNLLTKKELGGNLKKDIIRECFNMFYEEGIFLEVIYSTLVEYDGGGLDYFYWHYPDMDSPYPEDKFKGVRFQIGIDNPNTTVFVTEQESFEYAKIACKKFLEKHPKHQKFLQDILIDWNPINI